MKIWDPQLRVCERMIRTLSTKNYESTKNYDCILSSETLLTKINPDDGRFGRRQIFLSKITSKKNSYHSRSCEWKVVNYCQQTVQILIHDSGDAHFMSCLDEVFLLCMANMHYQLRLNPSCVQAHIRLFTTDYAL